VSTTGLEGLVALVTGGSRGLGAVTAKRLAADGATVIVNYRAEREAAEAVVLEIEAAGGKAVAMQADVTVEDDVRRLFAGAIEQLGVIRLLFNNAGIMTRGRIVDMDVSLWDEMMASHLRGAFLTTREFLRSGVLDAGPIAGRRVAGKIVNMSSGVVPAGGRSAVDSVHYVTAKAGMEGFTHGLAGELAESGITVNMVRPGVHFTAMGKSIPQEQLDFLSTIFLLGLPRDEDVANAVAFFFSEGADHLTDEVLTPNGGRA